ncbi:MAG: tRNA uridine-5-carboxymethylaminomethyl(34) synthesis GTPase MnmE [Clostridia bacterium]|nr:tRNA uridine-5-carboxymethylaminomethyl(34) synthesis GTPase MnmE [Clostridia bacterium]
MDTICAIATPRGKGGISVIRISGPEAFTITKKIFSSKKDIEKAEGYTILHGSIKDGDEKVDEVLVSVFRAPKSFTGENVCEISCHGGVIVTERILDLLLNAGCSLADKGEFTKRAFMNGKMSLTQAEAVHDIIEAKTKKGAFMAINRLDGALTDKIIALRDEIIKSLAMIQVSTDFPDEDIDSFQDGSLVNILSDFEKRLEALLKSAQRGIYLSNGARCAIVGMPNAGKSSLLNCLLEEEKAIVTHIPGTTRDVIEGRCEIDGVLINFLDTAGIRETDDVIEKIGVDKAKKLIAECDFVIFVTECGREMKDEEKEIYELIKDKNNICVLNKSDEFDEIREGFITISAKYGEGIDVLKNKISSLLDMGVESNAMIANERQRQAVKNALEYIRNAKKTLEEGFFSDLTVIDIHDAANELGEAEGMSVNDEVVDRIFKDFCLGK